MALFSKTAVRIPAISAIGTKPPVAHHDDVPFFNFMYLIFQTGHIDMLLADDSFSNDQAQSATLAMTFILVFKKSFNIL